MFFEQGPIRPPSEAESLLLRLTRNCPWNKCEFCTTYKGEKFSRRTVGEIKEDIDKVALIVNKIAERSTQMGYGGRMNHHVLNDIYSSGNYQVIHIATWLYRGGKTVFLQDANSLIMNTGELVEVLNYIKEKLPTVERVTSYARSKTLARKSLAELKEIGRAGLNRIHIGLESGSDAVLKFMNKGVTAAEHIEAGQKVVAAGISLSEYVLLGLGGKEWAEEHPIETARVLNQINPNFIRMRTLVVPEEASLYQKARAGIFTELTEDETVDGERLLIENLEGITSEIVSDHMLNLLEEVRGKMPVDKQRLLAVIDRYRSLPPREKKNYRLGRRQGLYRSLDDMADPARYARINASLMRLEDEGILDGTLSSLRGMMI